MRKAGKASFSEFSERAHKYLCIKVSCPGAQNFPVVPKSPAGIERVIDRRRLQFDHSLIVRVLVQAKAVAHHGTLSFRACLQTLVWSEYTLA